MAASCQSLAGLPQQPKAARTYGSGANIKVVQELVRHSTPVLTLNLFTKIQVADRRWALDALPPMGQSEPTREAVRATGTYGAGAEIATADTTAVVAPKPSQTRTNVHFRLHESRHSMRVAERRRSPGKQGISHVHAQPYGNEKGSGPRRIRTSDQGIMSPPL